MRMCMRLILLLSILILLPSCGDSRDSEGLQTTADGLSFDAVLAAKRTTERTIADALAAEVGVNWRVDVAINEDPTWSDRAERWLWEKTTASVILGGSGALSLSEDEIRAAVTRHLVSHQRSGSPKPVVTTRIERQGLDPLRSSATPGEGWSYTIKTGDTLADISSVFYGSPEHWRRILDANPGLRADALPVDTRIAIPPAP